MCMQFIVSKLYLKLVSMDYNSHIPNHRTFAKWSSHTNTHHRKCLHKMLIHSLQHIMLGWSPMFPCMDMLREMCNICKCRGSWFCGQFTFSLHLETVMCLRWTSTVCFSDKHVDFRQSSTANRDICIYICISAVYMLETYKKNIATKKK